MSYLHNEKTEQNLSLHDCRADRMELKDGIPVGARTLCAVTLLLTSEKSARETAGKLEQYMLAHKELFWQELTAAVASLSPDRPLQLDVTDVGQAAVGAALLAAARHEIRFE